MTDTIATTPEIPEIFPKPAYDELVERAQLEAKTWYGRSLPRRIASYEFMDFVARSWVFAKRIAPTAILQVMKSAPAAMTDGSTIWMPGDYFKEEFYKERGDIFDFVAAGVMCINGSQIHEALHCKLSICNLPDWAKTNARSAKYMREHLGFATVLNLVEDVYIETYGRQQYEVMSQFIDGKNNILLGSIPAWKVFNQLYSPEATQDHLLMALTLLKNTNHREDERWTPFLPVKNSMLRAAKPFLTQEQRLMIACDTWELLMTATNAEGDPLPQGSMMEQGPDTSSPTMGGILSPEEVEKFLEALGEALEEMEREAEAAKSESAGSDPGETSTGKATEKGAGSVIVSSGKKGSSGLERIDKILHLSKMVANMDGDVDKDTDSKLKVLVDELIFQRGEGKVNLSGIPGIEWKDIQTTGKRTSDIQASKEFVQLGHLLRYMRQEKHQAGQPRDKGSMIVKSRLSRIATDGKVMAIRDSKHLSKGKPEVILLVDMSGSMESGRLIQKVAEASYGAYNSLVASGISVACYGHTATSGRGSGYTPLVYGIAAYNMPLIGKNIIITRNPAKAFATIPEVEHSQNFDGIAIEALAKRFTSRPGSKLLIVLSDGQPHGGSNYGGTQAFNHTAQVIRDVNRSGIAVISLSLTAEVMESNSKLYRKGNLPAYGSLLNKTLQHVVQVVALGEPLS